jgi:hypothetical protein
MSMPSSSPPDSNEELLRLFWERLSRTPASGEEQPRQQREVARRVVVAVGPATEGVTLAAAFAEEFSCDLPM